MRPFHLARAGALACALAACALATAQTMNDSTVSPTVAKNQKQELRKGDPARWYKADNTNKSQVRNKEKEIAAAYRESQAACRKISRQERAQCMKDARLTYEHDRSDVRALVSNAPRGEVRQGPVQAIEPAGAAATGSSQGGATQGAGENRGLQDRRGQGTGSQDARSQETGTQDGKDARNQ
jgi:hypothetical protein